MSKNIEIKAYVDDFKTVLDKALEITTQKPTAIYQDDTFFNCPNGRLKLRTFSRNKGELIFYQRPGNLGPSESFYIITKTETPEKLHECLTCAYGSCGRVRKKRLLLMTGRTRIHLDDVEGLGKFIELEVVLKDKEQSDAGTKEAKTLMEKLGIKNADLIQDAYVDMIKANLG